MKFIYEGPHHSTTIDGGKDGKPLFEGTLTNGTVLELPDDHPVAVVWMARGWLTKPEPEPEPKPAPEPEPAPAPVADTKFAASRKALAAPTPETN